MQWRRVGVPPTCSYRTGTPFNLRDTTRERKRERERERRGRGSEAALSLTMWKEPIAAAVVMMLLSV
jgi:hypothetical protein